MRPTTDDKLPLVLSRLVIEVFVINELDRNGLEMVEATLRGVELAVHEDIMITNDHIRDHRPGETSRLKLEEFGFTDAGVAFIAAGGCCSRENGKVDRIPRNAESWCHCGSNGELESQGSL